MKSFLLIFLVLTLIGPTWIILTKQIDFNTHWQMADRQSAHLAPNPMTTKEAVIQAYAARAFHWRGIFSSHTWLAFKEKNSDSYVVLQVIGWRQFHGMSAVVMQHDVPDRAWFGQKPSVILDLRGLAAEKLIPQIIQAVKNYPDAAVYQLWPGPNSNTFIAYIARQVPELGLMLPGNAVGKDFLPDGKIFARAPSGTGYQVSLLGVFGLLLAKEEGIEINFLGGVYGFDFQRMKVKLPGL